MIIALQIRSVLTIAWIGSDFLTSGAFIPLVLGFLWVRGTSKDDVEKSMCIINKAYIYIYRISIIEASFYTSLLLNTKNRRLIKVRGFLLLRLYYNLILKLRIQVRYQLQLPNQ